MNNAVMDPRRLELLLELSRLGSMRAVAETMHVTTSTVSQQIAVLAREAGTPLIEPAGRRVRLTPAGRRLADHAVTILAALEAAREEAKWFMIAALGLGLIVALILLVGCYSLTRILRLRSAFGAE